MTTQQFPWYDSWWLTKYSRARDIIQAVQPHAIARFDAAFRVLHTPATFETRLFDQVFDETVFEEIQRTVGTLRPTDLEIQEIHNFGRFVVHGHPLFTRLQDQLVPLVSAAVGEEVEPRYNFLSLYTPKGRCQVHLDAPAAKWTLDFCVSQTASWPIYFSQVIPWPEPRAGAWVGDDWETAIKRSPSLRFTPYEIEPGQAVIFSGSSQWHFREPFPAATGHCRLLFFHYVPRGTAGLLDPQRWPELFGVPELSELA